MDHRLYINLFVLIISIISLLTQIMQLVIIIFDILNIRRHNWLFTLLPRRRRHHKLVKLGDDGLCQRFHQLL